VIAGRQNPLRVTLLDWVAKTEQMVEYGEQLVPSLCFRRFIEICFRDRLYPFIFLAPPQTQEPTLHRETSLKFLRSWLLACFFPQLCFFQVVAPPIWPSGTFMGQDDILA